MKYRKFSDLGWNVSEVGLGCWQLGWGWGNIVSERDVRELLKETIDRGINFLIHRILMEMDVVKNFYLKS